MVKLDGPRVHYRELIESGTMTPDPAQSAVVEELQIMHEVLAGYHPGPSVVGWRARLGLQKKSHKDTPRGLYIHGTVGRGKSMLMDLFFEDVSVERKRRVHFHEFMQEAHELIHQWRKANQENKSAEPIGPTAAKLANRNWLLCFDEFEVRDIADAMIVSRLFHAMFDLGVVVVATSNRHPDDLYKDGLQRDRFLPFIEILKDRMRVLHLTDGKDYRLDRLKGMAVYHVPADARAEEELAMTFVDLTDGGAGKPVAIEFRGRRIQVPKAYGRVAWFGFADLCETPLGPGDFLVIARHFHSILVSGVPLMSDVRRDAARRFMNLIDTLYDNHIHLILSADAHPDILYEGEDWKFEFERTTSRLIEMQSADYIESARARIDQDD
ncbi:MAG: cell division protein ZapE [Rhodospirillaceae bacterium]|nr:cell division protein ZapE [Rhodospirillaceae bacterium]